MNDNLLQHLAQFSRLDCKVAKRFQNRPTLRQTAEYMLLEQWSQRHLGRQHDPLNLYLSSHDTRTEKTFVRPLAQVLVERYCLGRTLNLTEGSDTLLPHQSSGQAGTVDIDLHEVEMLINDAGPLLISVHQQQLVAYWSLFDSAGQTPWQWFARYLRKQLQSAIEVHKKAASLSGYALATATLVQGYPAASQRRDWSNAQGLVVSNLQVDYASNSNLDVDLASAVLIEHADGDPARDLTLVFTLAGRLYGFESRQVLLDFIARFHAETTPDTTLRITITPAVSDVFEEQALGLLNQQLRVIDTLAQHYHGKFEALWLNRDLDRFTSMIDLCNEAEAAQRQSLSTHLPNWLQHAPSRPLMHYSQLLIEVAQRYQDAQGRFWLDGVPTAEAFANQQLAQRMATDHPGATCNPEQVQVINHQVTATAAASQGSLVTSGEEHPVVFTLAQLAIGNLGLLRPGRVTLSSTTAQPLPSWMTEHYLRTLVSELDVATTYPALLRRELLDNAEQRQQREQLLKAQLEVQLPALVMELHLQGKIPDSKMAEHVSQLFSPTPTAKDPEWVMRRLGFIKSPGSAVDHPRNTWLIERSAPNAEACLLYRPLHEDALLYFEDRLALFVAISTPGPLQDDLLQRLPAEDRRFYDHGGFLEPHLFVPLEDTSAVPFGTPAAVSIAVEPAVDELAQALYLACVNESISRFEAHSASTAQTRWNSWKELGWLLFNTLLPLAGSSLGKVAWLAQMEIALAQFVATDSENSPTEHRLAMVDLLTNIAVLLFSRSLFQLRLEQPLVPAPAVEPPSPALVAIPAPEVSTTPDWTLDFSWSRPNRTLGPALRQELDQLQASVPVASLGTPIPSGRFQGLYLQGTKFYVALDGHAYEVTEDATLQQTRIVGKDHAQGPLLQRNELGHWQLDLRLGLKGGMPLKERVVQRQLEALGAVFEINNVIQAEKATFADKTREMTAIEGLANMPLDDSRLASCQDKISVLSRFWQGHLEHLVTRNGLKPVKDFNTVHAYALQQISFCERVLHKILHKRYQPQRAQLLEIAKEQKQGQALTAADVQIARTRLDHLEPLIERMIENNDALRKCVSELRKLASPRFADITRWLNQASSVPASAEKGLILRFLRLESLVNRLSLVHGLDGEGPYWLDRLWDNLELGIAQRAKLYALPQADEEVSARLLLSIKGHLEAAKRQLGNLTEEIHDDAALQTIQVLHAQLDGVLSDIASDLAELPDYPPISTLGQLRKKVPGLIETIEGDVLLGNPRAEDATTVDVPGPDNKTRARTYRLKQGNWVEVKPATAQVTPSQRSLKRLLKDSAPLMSKARAELESMRRASANYLPVEIEEAILHQRDRLQGQIDAIEARLTDDNETDEAAGGLDAEGTVKDLRTLANELKTQASTLRVNAALTQKPRMAEVQFLLAQGEVQVAKVGTRTRLAKIKGRPADFLDEYSVSHAGSVLWYAHFHYAAMDTAEVNFTAGHLKTLAQRHAAGQRVTDANGTVTEVYRAPITSAAASAHFFNL
ncbi:DUF6543 domain-containing protein [Pseudomonas xantholysinigenes]|uniref:Uncharacterized protein n=1 Tax=Pseudomonas xantholysinigenes TaxID=2745490 RepID=A0A9E6PT06_9PSED|nr:DUF6543 domain-containing protein [Pseudomonas xantholysinigenes]QXI36840.1 hypothetical protein HU772_015965 [Pseudomonas xantholysinigenes]